MVGMCPATPRSRVIGPIDGKSCGNTIWHCRFECCAIFRGRCASPSGTSLAPDGPACRRLPALHLLVAFGVAVERAFEIAQRDDETRPAVDEPELEYVVLQERPDTMPEGASHRPTFVRELGHTECRVAVHLADDFLEIAERELPDRIFQSADRPSANDFVAFVHRLERVADAAFAEELRLTEIRIPPRSLDPPAHHVAAPRHHIDVVRGRAGQQGQNLVAHGFGTALVGIKTENPFELATFYRTVAQVSEALERHIHDTRAEGACELGGAIDAEGIDHDNFVGPQYARHGRLDLFRLVIGEDIG